MSFTAVYIRVSTASQNEAGQKKEIERWLDGNSVDRRNVKWYLDKSTGDNLNRPEFERLQKDIFNGLVKSVVVYKLDRLSRSLRDGINTLTDWLEKGIRLVSTTQQLDFAGVTGKLIAAVLLAIAEMEQQTRRERQAAGIAVAKSNGIYKGRKKGATKAGIDTARAAQLREQGLTFSEIAAALKVSVSSVRRYLRQQEQHENSSTLT
jgi:DNA invertase Pin-like site-specific DNA recombinase